MQGVTVVDHPLVQHKLTIMRKKETSTAGFRRLLREISLLLGYEVTRNLELTTTTIETPMETMEAPTLEGKKLVFAAVLRAGNGLRKACSTWFRRPASPMSVSTAITKRWKRSNISSRRRAISPTGW
jgi:uracil phosphoribosyltransferase